MYGDPAYTLRKWLVMAGVFSRVAKTARSDGQMAQTIPVRSKAPTRELARRWREGRGEVEGLESLTVNSRGSSVLAAAACRRRQQF